MRRCPHVRGSLVASFVLHAVFFALIVYAFKPATYRLPGAAHPQAVIQVSAISSSTIQHQIETVQKARRKARQRKLAIARRRARRRALKIKRAQELRLAKVRQLELKRLSVQQQQLTQKLREQQLERQKAKLVQVQTREREARVAQGIVNQYIPKILAAIQYKWFVPPDVNHRLMCRYQIELAPGGVVLSVKLLSSSGNAALDRSAEQAIWQASPLPVPTKMTLFNKMRLIRLTLRPEKVESLVS